jgi:hypothetical protein
MTAAASHARPVVREHFYFPHCRRLENMRFFQGI